MNSIDFPPRYNITPTQPIAAIWEQQGRRTIQLVRWGFVPGWVKDPREFSLLINARAETMAEKPSFRDAVRNSRCIVPASGYYEWMKGQDGKRRPYYITMADDSPMVFAGLYSQWAGPNGEEVDTVCIVTVEPNLEISSVYDRMPAMLTGDAVDMWLNTRDFDATAARQLAAAAAAGLAEIPPGRQGRRPRRCRGPGADPADHAGGGGSRGGRGEAEEEGRRRRRRAARPVLERCSK